MAIGLDSKRSQTPRGIVYTAVAVCAGLLALGYISFMKNYNIKPAISDKISTSQWYKHPVDTEAELHYCFEQEGHPLFGDNDYEPYKEAIRDKNKGKTLGEILMPDLNKDGMVCREKKSINLK